jgi:hypothetical protein
MLATLLNLPGLAVDPFEYSAVQFAQEDFFQDKWFHSPY